MAELVWKCEKMSRSSAQRSFWTLFHIFRQIPQFSGDQQTQKSLEWWSAGAPRRAHCINLYIRLREPISFFVHTCFNKSWPKCVEKWYAMFWKWQKGHSNHFLPFLSYLIPLHDTFWSKFCWHLNVLRSGKVANRCKCKSAKVGPWGPRKVDGSNQAFFPIFWRKIQNKKKCRDTGP